LKPQQQKDHVEGWCAQKNGCQFFLQEKNEEFVRKEILDFNHS